MVPYSYCSFYLSFSTTFLRRVFYTCYFHILTLHSLLNQLKPGFCTSPATLLKTLTKITSYLLIATRWALLRPYHISLQFLPFLITPSLKKKKPQNKTTSSLGFHAPCSPYRTWCSSFRMRVGASSILSSSQWVFPAAALNLLPSLCAGSSPT